MSLEPSVVEPRMPRGPQLLLGTALTSLAVLLIGRPLLEARPEPTPASRDQQLQRDLRWATDPERRRLAALLLVSRSSDQPRQQWQLLRGQGWGTGPLAPVAIKQQALAAERLGRTAAANQLWRDLQQRFPKAAATADALYALGRRQPELRQQLLQRFPAHPAALAAAIDQAMDPAQTPTHRQAAALHLARFGPRWPGAREVLLQQCKRTAGPEAPLVREQLALGLAQLGESARALSCLKRPATSLNSAAATLTLGTALLMAADGQDPALPAQGRAALINLLRHWPQADATEAALRALAEDPSKAGLRALNALPARWRTQAPVQARLALEGLADGAQVLRRFPNAPASWELRWELARRALRRRDWQRARTRLELPPGSRLPSPLAARQRFWLGFSLEKLGQTAAARTLWQTLLQQDGGGYYGWRASVHLGREALMARLPSARADAVLNRLEQESWSPLNSHQTVLERLWQAGQILEAWELWRHSRSGALASSADDLRVEGLLRLGLGDDGHGLEQLERASLRRAAPSCGWRQQLEQGLHPLRFANAFRRAAAGSGLNPALLLGVAKAESQFMPAARSPVGAIGLLQLMPETARELAGAAVPERTLENPDINSRLGARYLRQLLEHWHGNLLPAVASYNAGAGAVTRWNPGLLEREPELWVETIPYPETRLYVKKVLGNAWSYQRGARLGCSGGS
ncbi:MAG: transglycosylase SLT domain-containing protein [Cyanobacteriota bacterium]